MRGRGARIIFSFLFFVVFACGLAQASIPHRCDDLFIPEARLEAIRSLVVSDAVEQWRIWEAIGNRHDMRKPTTPVAFRLKAVPVEKVEVWSDSESSNILKSYFVSGGQVLWPEHPYVESSQRPFADVPVLPYELMAYLTASRSAVPVEFSSFTMKTPTDRPHGDLGPRDIGKLLTRNDIRDARLRNELFHRVDRVLGEDPFLIKMFDVFALIEKSSGDGVLFRDISVLQDGHYYLPAFSIPYVGRAIAALHGRTFEEFFGEAYAEALGRVKARMLLRYGIQMDTPNSQNFLIQLDRNLRPTGRIVVRDIPDSYFVRPVAEAFGLGAAVEADREAGLRIDLKINPNWENSRFLFDEAGEFSIPIAMLERWEHRHDVAYITEIERALGVVIVANKKARPAWLNSIWPSSNPPLSRLQEYLSSAEGQERLRAHSALERVPPGPKNDTSVGRF